MLGKPKGPPRAWDPPEHPLLPTQLTGDASCPAADVPPCPRRDLSSVSGCGNDVFQKVKFASPGFSLHSLFCPITEGQMCCSMVRAEEQGSRLPSTDLPSHHSISLPHRVIVRKTHTELQQHLGSCCRTHPCTIVFYNLDFAAGPKLGGKEAL